MSTRFTFSSVARLILGAAFLMASSACGSELLRTGRAPVYVVVNNMTAHPGGGFDDSNATLYSDVITVVETVPSTFSDDIEIELQAELKNPSIGATPINNVTFTRYHVNYRRTDGRNTPGVDVPYPIDGAVGVTVEVGSPASVLVEAVRHQAKLESPLRQLRNGGSLIFISAIAEITLYGRDQNGNEVVVTALMDVQFGDYGDPS